MDILGTAGKISLMDIHKPMAARAVGQRLPPDGPPRGTGIEAMATLEIVAAVTEPDDAPKWQIDEEFAEDAVAAFRSGDLDMLQAIGETAGPPRPRTQDDLPKPKAPQPTPLADSDDLKLASSILERSERQRQAFASAADGTEVGRKLFEELAGMDAGMALALRDTEIAAVICVQRAMRPYGDSKAALMLVRALGNVIEATGALNRRMQGEIAAAARLRAQRRLMPLPRGPSASEGALLPGPARRLTPARPRPNPSRRTEPCAEVPE